MFAAGFEDDDWTLTVNGETYEVKDFQPWGKTGLLIEVVGGSEWYVFENEEDAGDLVREYWQDMADNDPEELRCILGDEALVQMALGQDSLKEWIEQQAQSPEYHFGSYDFYTYEAELNDAFLAALEEEVVGPDFMGSLVAYRCN